MLGFDDYPDLAARLDRRRRRPGTRRRTSRVDRRTLLPITPARRQAAVSDVARARPRLGARSTACASTTARSPTSSWRPGATVAARSARSRPSAARSCPGRRTTCSPRRAGSPRRASASSCWSARTRRPTARTSATSGARVAAAAAVRGAGHRPGTGVLPAAGRDAPVAASRPSPTTPGVAPYFDLSFQHASPTVLRRMRRFGSTDDLPRPARPHPRALAPGGGDPQQRDRRLPRRDRGRRRRARAVPDGRPARRGRRVRLLGRGRHRGRGLRRQAPDRARSPHGSSGSAH